MVREPVVAGAFYPADPALLREAVAGYLSDSRLDPDPDIAGVVSPHAGYVYSGPVAGYAFAAAPASVDTVIILAPSHSYPIRGASVYTGTGYRTPLGVCEIDGTITDRLTEIGLSFDSRAHSREHSAEVQVPFVQVKWPDARIVVIVQGAASHELCSGLAGMLDTTLEDDGYLIVASSDLSHYHPLDTAGLLDGRVIDAFLSGDEDRLGAVFGRREGEACGGGPMTTLLSFSALRGFSGFRNLAYDTSATASGDRSAVVGYFAGAVTRGTGI
jgi:AmmeMemoRadiSam system protein B